MIDKNDMNDFAENFPNGKEIVKSDSHEAVVSGEVIDGSFVEKPSTTELRSSDNAKATTDKNVDGNNNGKDMKKKKRFYKNKIFLACLGVILILLIAGGIILGPKIYKIFVKATVLGNITGSSSSPIIDAKITVDNIINTSSDTNGYFTLTGLDKGKHTIVVKYNGYQDINKSLMLVSGDNKVTLNMSQLQFGNIIGTLSSGTVGDPHLAGLNVVMGQYKATTDSSGKFTFSNIPVASYELDVSSSFYMAVKQNESVNPGDQTFNVIPLTPGGEVKGTIKDWLSGSAIPNTSMILGDNVNSINSNGTFDVSGIQTGKITISIKPNNYNQYSQQFTINQGVNDLGEIDLIPSGGMAYASSVQGNNNIYISNYDGSNSTQITDNSTSYTSPSISSDTNIVYFFKTMPDGTEQLQSYNIKTKQTSIVFNTISKGTNFDLNLETDISNQAYLSNDNVFNTATNQNTINIYYNKVNTSPKTLDSIISQTIPSYIFSTDKTKVYYATTSNIYSIGTDATNKTTLFTLPSINSISLLGQQSNFLYYEYTTNNYGQTTIAKLDLGSNQSTTIKVLPFSVNIVANVTSDTSRLLYTHIANGITNIYSISTSDGTIAQITQDINVQSIGHFGKISAFVGQASGGGVYNMYLIGPNNNIKKSIECDQNGNFNGTSGGYGN